MDQTKLQPATNVQAGTTAANKPNFNLNHNFILVPASNPNLLTNNGQVSNLIATNHNSIVNKGKIMILTTTPAIAASMANNATGINHVSTTVTPIALTNQQCIHLRPPNLATGTSGNNVPGTTMNMASATSIIANIKMTPNQSNVSQIHQIVPTMSALTAAGSSNKPQAIQMLTPLIPTSNIAANNKFQSRNPQSSRSTPGNNLVAAKSNSFSIQTVSHTGLNKLKTNSISTTASSNSISTTPVILNGSNLFVQDYQGKSKPSINLNLISEKTKDNHSKRKTITISNKTVEEQSMNIDEESNQEAEIKNLVSESQKCPPLFSEEKLDRSSPELWPESVPGVIKFLANTSPLYPSDEDEYDDSLANNQNNDASNQKKLTTSPVIMGLSSIVKNEILDDDDEEDEDDDDYDETFNSKLDLNVNQSTQKMVKSFSITPYGLESAIEMDDIGKRDDDSRATSPSAESLTNGSNVSNSKTASSATASKPEWHKDFDDEELSMLYGFGSLTSSCLFEKVKEIQNLAFQLGLEEEREIARARYLNILNEPIRNDDEYPNLTFDQEIDEIIYSEMVEA